MPNAASVPKPASPEVAGDSEFARVLRICDPGAALSGPLTFAPARRQTRQSWLTAWQEWRQTIFEPALAPALAAAAGHAQQDHAREMLDLDAGLGARLQPEVVARSTAAGRRLLQQLCQARGARWLGKFAERAAREQGTAHFAIIYAGQSAFFSSAAPASAADVRLLGMVGGAGCVHIHRASAEFCGRSRGVAARGRRHALADYLQRR